MHPRLAATLAALLLLTGCAAKSSAPPMELPSATPVQEKPASQTEPAAAEAKQPTLDPKQPAPAPPQDETEPLRQKIAGVISQKGAQVAPGEPRLFRLSLSPVPHGYTSLVAAVADMKLYLVAVSEEGDLSPLQQMSDLLVNQTKLEISSTSNLMTIWSQIPFGASSRIVELSWDGIRLTKVSDRAENLTAEFFMSRQKRLDARDIDGLMAIGPGLKDALYPAQELQFWTQPPQVLRLAYAKALERYKSGDLALALKTLQFGVDFYDITYGEILGESEPLPRGEEYALPLKERIPIANDLAFFLAESKRHKEALPLLERVTELAPDRAVAYLNLADVEWELGHEAEARAHYQKYLELVGPADRANAPERVMQRLK